MSILVVDDELFLRSAINAILQNAGFQTIEARDGLEAYELVRAVGASVELLLTDIRMPRMDGLSLIESVRALYPNMPVLLMTGTPLKNPPRGVAVLNKPIVREMLLESVRSVKAAAVTVRPARKVEFFNSGVCFREKLITAIRAAACPSCEIRVLDVTAPDGTERAKQLGVHCVPAVAINDELVCCPSECGTDLAKLRAAGLGVPLP